MTVTVPFDDDILAAIRDFVAWEPPTDSDLEDRYNVLADDSIGGNWQSVARSYVRRRRAELLAAPTSFSVDGGAYSESNAGQLAALDKILAELAAQDPLSISEVEDVTAVQVGTITRGDPRNFRDPHDAL